jgi:DNA-binding response OmpR family regulator
MTGRPTVLAVDDDPQVTALYETWLAGRYGVVTAGGGEAALDVVDRRDVDVVLLDRQMPGMSGREVVDRLRTAGSHAQVVMVTAVPPDLDVVGTAFDDYLEKPVDRRALVATVESALTRSGYARELERYWSLARRKGVLDANVDRARLASSGAYRQLVADLERARRAADARRDELDLFGETPVFAYE